MSAAAGPEADRTIVEFPATDAFRDVGSLVLGGVAARSRLPVDRVDDLLLAVESVLLQGPSGDTVRVEADATASGLVIRVGRFGRGRLDDAALLRVLSPLVDSVAEVGDGDGSAIELAVSTPDDPEGAWRP